MRKKLIAGNWKMNKTTADAVAFAQGLIGLMDGSPGLAERVDVALCAPFTALPALKAALGAGPVMLGAQNVHQAPSGAFTGEVSVEMLDDIGVDVCVIGHSERRQYFAETDEAVNLKLKAAFGARIVPIMCVGESLSERDAGQASQVVGRQLAAGLDGIPPEKASRLVIAYEPIWAIGTGRTATPAQAQEMCLFIREAVGGIFGGAAAQEVCIQYGGSVKPDGAEEILSQPDIDGALVGGASLDLAQFFAICKAAAL